VVAAVCVGFASAAPSAAPSHHRRHVRFVAAVGLVRRAALPKGPAHWVASWSAAPMAPAPNTLGATGFTDQTIRNLVYTSAGGTKVRVLVTNAFGTRPLDVGHAAIAVRGKAAGTGPEIPLTFRHRRSVVIKPGAAVFTDPVALKVQPLQELAVSVFLPRATGPATVHALAQQVNYVAHGDHVLDRGGAAFTTKTFSWYYVASVDVLAPVRNLGTLVALGDSITDGVNSSTNTNSRWPNDLARRLHPRTGETLSVVDEGIGGNRLLNTAPCCGVSALARFKRDVLHRAGVREVILLEGINDIGQSQHTGASSAPHNDISAEQIIGGYRRLIAEAHAAHLRIFGATILPFRGARYWTSAGEAKREAINGWILHSGAFDGVIDFSDAVEDAGVPTMLNPAYDSGDHLHPNRRGYHAMANAIDLKMLTSQAG
jgi:lysophospholipase L1-like esterase